MPLPATFAPVLAASAPNAIRAVAESAGFRTRPAL